MSIEKFRLVDLTHVLSPNVPTWGGGCGYCIEIKKDYDQLFRVQQMKMHAGIGTHIDAPSHRIQGGLSIADLPVENFLAPACVIDVSKKADAHYEISLQDIQDYEMRYGRIPKKALVIGYTGWSRFWSNSTLYRNADEKGRMHFPAFSKECIDLLLERDIVGIGIDTLSPDCTDPTFPVHERILGAGKYILENLAHCAEIPPQGAYVIALPLKASEATESPVRVVGLVETAGKK